jgi:cytochrome c oxidase assembly protein subunit 11
VSQQSETQKTRVLVVKLLCFGVCMFVFAVWVMPPIYTLFCELTGINGKTAGKYQAVSAEVDLSRTVTVQFVATNNENMPWAFAPSQFSMDVHPGEIAVTHFKVRNPSDNIMVAQAVPSMVPSNAIDYFHKTECFCFNRQALAPGEQADLGLQFIVDQAIPKGISTIILSYSLFDVTDMSPGDVAAKQEQMQAQLQYDQQAPVDAESGQTGLLTAHTN